MNNKSFKLFRPGLFNIFVSIMLCSQRILMHNGKSDHYHPVWSLGEYVRGEVSSQVQMSVQVHVQVPLEEVPPRALDLRWV